MQADRKVYLGVYAKSNYLQFDPKTTYQTVEGQTFKRTQHDLPIQEFLQDGTV